MVACEGGHTAVVDTLLERGADVNARDKVVTTFVMMGYGELGVVRVSLQVHGHLFRWYQYSVGIRR